ncbi:MAG: hypothetical protein JWO63_919 [Frankiales bacterium]|nr:hypothetical protein [Frankiales bacterium]
MNADGKVRAPDSPPQFVSRPRLSTELTRGARQPVTLIAAGPWSAQTVMLTDSAQPRSTPNAWLSLDAPDNYPARFWSLVGEALFAAGITEDAESFSSLPHDPDGAVQFFEAFRGCLDGPAERHLIIDDAHFLSDPTLLAELDVIIRYGSSYLKLVLSARTDPLLPLHRYRLAGQMHEIRAEALAMTKPEARALLTIHGVNLSGSDLALLTRRTEGWAAGLRLSAMSMAGSRHPEQFITQLAMDQGSVGEYLMEEVLAQQDPSVRQLLVQTSFLREVSASLAAAVTGIDASGELLAELSRTNSFVVALDRGGGRYRYHQLFGEILSYLLIRDFPTMQDELRRRASDWFEKQGDTASAMRYAIAAHDYAHAASVLVNGGLATAYVEREDLPTFEPAEASPLEPTGTDRWGSAGRPTVEGTIAQAGIAVMHGDVELAQDHLRHADFAEMNPKARTAAVLVSAIAAQRSGQLAELDSAAESLIELSETPAAFEQPAGLRAALRLSQASTRFWNGSAAQEVESYLLDARREAGRESADAVELECLDLLALSSVLSGRLEHAKDYDRQCHDLVRSSPRLHLLPLHHLVHANALMLRGDFSGATRCAQRAEQTAGNDLDDSVRAAAALTRVWLAINTGQLADAHLRLRTAPELAARLPKSLLRSKLLAMAELETALGRPHAAVNLLRGRSNRSRDPLLGPALARAHLRLGEIEDATTAIRPILIAADTTPPLPQLLLALLVSAQIAEARGDEARAVEEVLRATELAADGLNQPFVSERRSLAGLLSRHPETRSAWPSAGGVVVDEARAEGGARPRRLAEPLTDREVSVLRRLATTMTTAEIAEELCVSINTVKTHIAAIYRKLPAAGRRDAVWRARQLELL